MSDREIEENAFRIPEELYLNKTASGDTSNSLLERDFGEQLSLEDQSRLRAIDCSPFPWVMFNPGKQATANKAFYELGQDRIKEIFEENGVRTIAQAMMKDEITTPKSGICTTADGTKYKVTASPFPGLDGKTSVQIQMDDVTNEQNLMEGLRRENEELKEREAASRELFATGTHDLRTPLAEIILYAQVARRELLARENPDKDKIDLYLNEIEAAGRRSNQKVTTTLDMVKTPEFKPEIMALTDVLGQVIDDNQKSMALEKIELKFPVLEPHLFINGDPNLLPAVFNYPIGNAFDVLKNVKGPRKLTISYEIEDNDIIFYITDNGTGITEEDQRLLFTDYSSKKDTGEGSGYGLRRAKEIAQQHGGNVWLVGTATEDMVRTNPALTRGTTFGIRLPLSKLS